MKTNLHPDNLVANEKYEISLANGKTLRARFLTLTVQDGKLVLVMRACGVKGMIPWSVVTEAKQYV